MFAAAGSLYYIKEAYRIKGWKPFTAQILSATISTIVDFIIAKSDGSYFFISSGNLFAAISSFALGFYSLKWSMTAEGASGVDICNSLLVILNGFINLIQAMTAFFRGKDSFDYWNDWLASLEAFLGCIIMIITMFAVEEIGEDDYLAFFISAIICVDGLFDHLCSIKEEQADENYEENPNGYKRVM